MAVALTSPAGSKTGLFQETDILDIDRALTAGWTVSSGTINPYDGLPNSSSDLATLLKNQTSFPTVDLHIPMWVKRTLTFTDFSAAATSSTVTAINLPAAGIVHAVRMKHSAAFSGGAISAYTVSVGISGNHTKYAAAFDVHQAVADTAFQTSSTLGQESDANIVAITATATSTGANTSAATAGSVDIWILISRTA